MILIQKTVKNFLKCRYGLYISLLVRWQKVSLSINKFEDENGKGVPFLTQVHYLHIYINKKIKDFLAEDYKNNLAAERKKSIKNKKFLTKKTKNCLKIFSEKYEFKELLLEVLNQKKKWEFINMKEYAYWKHYKMHPIESYLRSKRFRHEHDKKRSVVKLLKQYTAGLKHS